MSWGVLPWVYLIWGSVGFLDLGDYFLPRFRDVFNYYLLKYFLMVFLFVFFWDSYDSNVIVFNTVLEVSEIVLITFNSFFFFPLWFIYFSHSIFYFTIPIFCLCYSTICSLQSVLILFIALFITYWLFFISSRSLLNLSCIFSILVSRLFIYNSNLFLRFLDHFHYHYLEFFLM